MDFLDGRTIQVKVGTEIARQYIVENGTPQGNVVSPTLFTIAINNIFGNISMDMGRSPFADDEALWKRGRNIEHINEKMQEGINQVEKWGTKWGFKLSVEKTTAMFFSKKKIRECNLKIYGNNLERVDSFCFFGSAF